MLIEVYSKPNCEYCNKAKILLNRFEIPYTVYEIGKDVDRDTVIKRFPSVPIVPIIVKDGELMGTYAQLVNWVATTDFSKKDESI